MVRLLLSHSPTEMARLSDWLDEQEQVLPIPNGLVYAVRLCLEEAVANLISHTPATSEGPDITVDLAWQGDVLIAAIEDHGPPFDPRTAPAPARPASLDDATPGGLGIMLMLSFATDIEYDTVPGRNRLTLRFAQPAENEPISGRT
jgi:anti-sigma regulatory factor (Ser/Thr protein kinase)